MGLTSLTSMNGQVGPALQARTKTIAAERYFAVTTVFLVCHATRILLMLCIE